MAFHRNTAQLFLVADALGGSKTTPAAAESHRGANRWGHAERQREDREKKEEKLLHRANTLRRRDMEGD